MSTREMAKRYSELWFDELPPNVLVRAKQFVLDTLGVAIGGQDLPSSSLVADLVRDMGGVGESTVIGNGLAPASLAALVNATTAQGLELDDVDNSSSLHPGAVIIPAALAVGESVSASGREVLAAIVAGYDAIIRIGRAGGAAGQYERGFHPTATCGAFGAAVAAGRVLRLDEDRLANAMGIAGSFAAGNLEYISNGAWTKRLQVGGAAQAGTVAALLSSRGYTGPTTILEGSSGYLQSHSTSPDVTLLTADLSEPFAILDVSIKPFACCRYSQTPIDAVLELLSQEDVNPYEITRVDVGIVSAGLKLVAEPRHQNDIERKFRETRLYSIAPVSNNLILAFLGQHVLGMPRSY